MRPRSTQRCRCRRPVTAASLQLWRIEPKGKKTDLRYPIVDVPAIAFPGLEMERQLIDTWPPASHRRLFDELSLKSLDARDQSGLDYEVVSDDPETRREKVGRFQLRKMDLERF